MKKRIAIVITAVLLGVAIGLTIYAFSSDTEYEFTDVLKPIVGIIGGIAVLGKLILSTRGNSDVYAKYAEEYRDLIRKAFSGKDDASKYRRLMQGIDQFNKDQYKKAVKTLTALYGDARSREDKCATLIFLALSHEGLDCFYKAAELYETLLEIDETYSSAWSNLGLIYRKNGKLQESIACFEKAILHDPQNAYAYNNLGNAYYGMGDYEKAVVNGEKALSVKSNLCQAANLVCLAYYAMGEFEKSKTYFGISVANGGNGDKLRRALESLAQKEQIPQQQEQASVLHEMRLHPEPFGMIACGKKTIELRLYDEKRQTIKVGDHIRFTNTADGTKQTAKVIALHRFASFRELYQHLPLEQCGYTEETVGAADASDMERYYSADEQKAYGVVGIELALLSDGQ